MYLSNSYSSTVITKVPETVLVDATHDRQGDHDWKEEGDEKHCVACWVKAMVMMEYLNWTGSWE